MDKIIAESPWMTITAKANKVVEIDIEGTIGGSFWEDEGEESVNTKEKMRAELKAIANTKADQIIVNINSYGGDVNHGISIHDMLAKHPAEVTTRVNGFTASIATVIAMAGNNREISSNSLFLIHKPSLMLLGGFNENDMDNMKRDLGKVQDRITSIYTKRGVDAGVVTDLMEENGGQGRWLDAEEAMGHGFVDSVFEPLKMAACVNAPELLNHMGISQLPPKIQDMQTTEVIASKFEELKAWISDKLGTAKPAEGEGEGAAPEGEKQGGEATMLVAPAEIEDRLTAMAADIAKFETDASAVEELATLKATHEETVKEVEQLKALNVTQKQKMVEMEGELTKLNGKGTKPEGPEGAEDPDGEVKDPMLKSLRKDLSNLRNTFEVTHS